MQDTNEPGGEAPRARTWLGAALGGAALVAAIYASSVLWPHPDDGNGSVQRVVHGRVTDEAGRPVPGAIVRGSWRVATGGSTTVQSTFRAICGADGRYGQRFAASGSTWDRYSGTARVRLTLQAHAPLDEHEPSPRFELDLEARGDLAFDLQLGAKLPTVVVRVLDADGVPVPRFRASTRPPGGAEPEPMRAWPHCVQESAATPTLLGVPQEPFELVITDLPGGAGTTAGPFDPATLPNVVEVTLPR